MAPVTVAAAAIQIVNDPAANLDRIARWTGEAAAQGARLVHFPEFVNQPAWYPDRDAAWDAALEPDSRFLRTLQDLARQHRVYLGFTATVRGTVRPAVFVQNHLLGPDGTLLGTARKQVLMYQEWDVFLPADAPSAAVDTEFGRVGLFQCMDGLVPETARLLALQGAGLLLDSLSSNARDEASLHIPARAAENHVYILAANRAGPLVDPADVPDLVRMTGIPEDLLLGAATPQVIGPDGSVLAQGAPRQESLAIATIDPARATRIDDPDGAGRLRDRRPAAYGILATPNPAIPAAQPGRPEPAAELRVAAIQAGREPGSAPGRNLESVVQNARRLIRLARADLAVLPELFPYGRERLAIDRAQAARDSAVALAGLRSVAVEMGCWIVTSLAERDGERFHNTGYLIGPDESVRRYRQVHVHREDAWAFPGPGFEVFSTPFGSLGIMVGYDGTFPESARVLARLGADIIAWPTTWRQDWEPRLGAPERAAENHVALVAAARPDSPHATGSVILAPAPPERFGQDGTVNQPERWDAPAGNHQLLVVTLDLRRSRDKRLMGRTDLLLDSRPDLAGPLVAPLR